VKLNFLTAQLLMKKGKKMPNYKVRLKHDTGFVSIVVAAKDTDEAIALVCKAEKAPLVAVRSVRLAR
jgi:hypothetical protein